MRIILKDVLYDGQIYEEVSFDYPDYDFYNFDANDYNDVGQRIFDVINCSHACPVLDNSVVIEK